MRRDMKEVYLDYLESAPEWMDEETAEAWAYEETAAYFDGLADYLYDQEKDRRMMEE